MARLVLDRPERRMGSYRLETWMQSWGCGLGPGRRAPWTRCARQAWVFLALAVAVGAVALATFENQDGLMKAGRNMFYGTIDSGPPKIGMAQTGTRGSIFASSLEESNVDLSTQLTNLIVAQQAYGANSKVLTIADQLLQELDQVIQS